MPIKILMPALSPTMTDGKLSKWLKKEGDTIKSGDVIAEIETDKATMEYECSEEGILGKILIQEGTEGVKVNDTIAVLLEKGESSNSIDSFLASNNDSKPQNAPQSSQTTNTTTPDVATQVVNNNSSSISLDAKIGAKKIFITPLAKRIAEQKGIDVSKMTGSGPNGRIIKVDVENFTSSSTSSLTNNPSATNNVEYEDKPNSGIRKTIAKRLLESKNTIPHYYLSVDCNLDNLLKARETLNAKGKDKYKLSVNDFIIKAVALALQDHPQANTNWLGETTRYFKNSDVAVAVATEGGLFTPIIKNAQSKGLVEISAEMKSLAKKAKEGKLQPSEYQGGSFSISNLGMFGIKEFQAIINPPHSGILAVGTTQEKAIVINKQIVIANIMGISLSADHRVLDGAIAAEFLTSIKNYLENPIGMIL